MTLDQIDSALAEWQSKVDLASANLLELDELFTCKRLKGSAGTTLAGITRDKVTPALAAMDHLWQSLSLLTDTLSRAKAMRKSASRLWPSEHTLREIEELLTGASIPLPAVAAPLANRELLSQSETVSSVSPEQLLTTMMRAFDAAKETILAVDAAWNRLEPLLADADGKATALGSLALSLGEPPPSDLDTARRKISFLRGRVAADPLGVHLDFSAEIAPLLARTQSWLDDLARQRDGVRADQARAHRLLQELTGTNRANAAADAECQAKIEPAGLSAPMEAAALADLSSWLTSLDTAYSQGRWKPARIGLERWLQRAEQSLKSEQASLAAGRARLETLAELRGCLSSLRVKANALAARGRALDPAVSALGDEADRLLQRPPVPLEEAARLVSQYETQLRRLPK